MYFYAFFWGVKGTADTMLTQTGIANEVGVSVSQEVNENRVSKALLRGEVTQQVEELRYRTYLVDREAKKFEFFSPTLAKKRSQKQDSKFVKYENSENLEVITIQPNFPKVETVTDMLDQVDKKDGKRIEYWVSCKRDFIPRFRIEEYTARVAVRKIDENDVMLDFYVSKYPVENDVKSIYFVKEVEEILNNNKRSDILDIKQVDFTTSHAFKLDDMMQFRFEFLRYRGIAEFDGYYVVKFRAKPTINGKDLTEQYYSATMDEKYKTNAKKEVDLKLDGGHDTQVFYCDECGKKIVYDTDYIDYMPIVKPRAIDEDYDDSYESMEYLDLQIAEQTFGKKLCKECFGKLRNKLLYEKK